MIRSQSFIIGSVHLATDSFNKLNIKDTLVQSVGNSIAQISINNSDWATKVLFWSATPPNFFGTPPWECNKTGCATGNSGTDSGWAFWPCCWTNWRTVNPKFLTSVFISSQCRSKAYTICWGDIAAACESVALSMVFSFPGIMSLVRFMSGRRNQNNFMNRPKQFRYCWIPIISPEGCILLGTSRSCFTTLVFDISSPRMTPSWHASLLPLSFCWWFHHIVIGVRLRQQARNQEMMHSI